MAGQGVRSIRGALACSSLLSFLFISGALAQAIPPAAPATLRLAQVVPRLPIIHLYASAQDERGNPVAERLWEGSKLSALVGPNYTSVKIDQQPEGIGIVFLIDISLSLKPQQFELMKASVRAWIESLGPTDRAAIVTLGSSVHTAQDFRAGDIDGKRRLNDALSPLHPRDQQTLLYQGLVQAIDLSRRLDRNLPLRRAIVVLTDGIDDQQGGAGQKEVLDKLVVDPTPIYGLGTAKRNDAKVDAALKDFAGLVRASGGDYRRIVDISSLNVSYRELRDIVNKTKDVTAECPPCAPDGSAIVVRLYMSQGPTILSSESVTVRSVGAEGQVVRAPPPPAPQPPPSPPPPPPPEPWWTKLLSFLANLPPQWKAVLALIAALPVAGVTIRLAFPDLLGRILIMVIGSPEPPKAPEPLKTTTEDPDIGMHFSRRVLIQSGTRQDKQRLRLYPIGHNEIGPFDLLFEGTLAVGRSPESEICISNDGQVSANHCALSPEGKFILVRDVGSLNGTRVNGVAINGFLHAEPDSVLGVGRTELRMKLLPVGAR